MENRPRLSAARGPVLILALLFAIAPAASASEAGALPLRPGEIFPQPGQRGLNEVESLPEREIACPVCGYPVIVPDVDKLMRRPPGPGAAAPRWRLHADSRDADLCPHPGPGKVGYRADIAVCPACGYAAPVDGFSLPIAPQIAEWVLATLKPNLHEVLTALLGKRAGEMDEAARTAFFNRQSAIPDVIRTEHVRIYAMARPSGWLDRAEATWQAAFALRRELVAPPRGDFLAARHANVREALKKTQTGGAGLEDEVEALRHLLGKNRSGQERLGAADRFAARLLLAGLEDRRGRQKEAEEILEKLREDCRERFARPEQDPLWRATSSRGSRTNRRHELETFRAEAEREVSVRLEMLRLEREHLANAATLLREGMLGGECDGQPDEALFAGYLVGEFLRRAGSLPLAAEWLQAVADSASAGSPIARAAGLQLETVRGQAGDRISLLSGMGQDSAALAKLREICR